MGKWPQSNFIDVIDDAITIRANKRHITRSFEKAFLHCRPIDARFAKACRVANTATSTHRRKLLESFNGRLTRDSQKHRIGRFRQIIDRRVASMPTNFAALRIDGPERTFKSDPRAFCRAHFRIAPTNDGDVART